jgi:hypothetical protein
LPSNGEDAPGFRWIAGLREIDEQAYLFHQHRGNPSSSACQTLAESELKNEDAPEWQRRRRSPWTFVVEQLWLDRACVCAKRGTMFQNLGSFDEALCQAARHAWAYGPVQVDPIALGFLREQDESGYTEALVTALWAEYRSDCEAMRLETPDDTPVGDGVTMTRNKRRFDRAAMSEQPVSLPSVLRVSGKPWEPPNGYVGTNEIVNDARFRKNGKNPVQSTIQRWVDRDNREAKKNANSQVIIERAPDTHECYYPESWVFEQIKRWHPRPPTNA